jgi:CRP-like cAMP-binding protein
MSDPLTLLRGHKLFIGAPEQSTQAIAAIARVERPAPGTKVFATAAPNENIYFVIGGAVRVLVGAVELGTLGAGEVLGGLSVLTPQNHAADVEAGEGCAMVVVPLAKLQALSKQAPNATSQMVFRLMRSFAVSARALGLEKLFH